MVNLSLESFEEADLLGLLRSLLSKLPHRFLVLNPQLLLGSASVNSNIYNLRQGLSSNKLITDDAQLMGIDEPSCNGTSVCLLEWNTEFKASILKSPYGKKPVFVDGTCREIYRQPGASSQLPETNMLMAEPKRLLPVGIRMAEVLNSKDIHPVGSFAGGLGRGVEDCSKENQSNPSD